jgi:lysozyme
LTQWVGLVELMALAEIGLICASKWTKGAIRPYLERIMSRLTASRAAFDLIASFEGFRTRAALAPDGQWTLGFGHTATARDGLSVTRSEAEDLLRWDLLPIEDMVRQAALTPLSQNQFDALVSFAYNIGIENFRTCNVLKYLNQGQPVAAALSMHAWRRAPVNGRVLTIDALVRRRAAEAALFLETTGARPAAPSSVIRPQIDRGAAPLLDTPVAAQSGTGDDVAELPLHEVTQAAIVPAAEPQAVVLVTSVAPEAANDLTTEDAGAVASPVDPQPAAPLSVPVKAPDGAVTLEMPSIGPARLEAAPVVTKAQAIEQDVLKQGPIIHPPVAIAPLASVAPISDADLAALSSRSPMIPDGLSPFPDSGIYQPANGTSGPISTAANDGLKTRLHNAPELLEMPADRVSTPIKAVNADDNRFSLLVWFLMALGAALFVGGLYFSWKSGLLTVTTPRREPNSGELSALLAAASGFIILVTSAISVMTGNRDND